MSSSWFEPMPGSQLFSFRILGPTNPTVYKSAYITIGLNWRCDYGPARIPCNEESGSRMEMFQVIGVVKTGMYAFLTEQPRPYLYLALRQNYTSPTIFHVRTATAPSMLVPALRQAIRALDQDLPVYNVKTMQDHLQHGYVFSTIILGGALSGLFGILGLALAFRFHRRRGRSSRFDHRSRWDLRRHESRSDGRSPSRPAVT
jgi:hypothetical protein